ncbi:MAG: nucleotidyltransferase domain-containing protein [Gammaproteobacteria bacterium]|nr:MAG: nucleotidyltransferase domain-containing protein [Gammaproteobacteria bacterium]
MNQNNNSKSRLGDALFTMTQQRVLGLLYGKPDESFYTKQILRLTGMGVHTIKRELDRMEATGIITMTKIGNQHHYQANPECPIYDELLGIVRKTFGVADVIKIAVEQLDEQIIAAFVYGSIAKAEDTATSDIDLMVIAKDLAYAEVMESLRDAEHSLGRKINPSIYGTHEIKKKLKQKNAFLTRVMEQPKLWIKGGEDDIETFR